MVAVEASAYTQTQNAVAAAPATAPPSSGATEFSFHDILDIINPLQHIPIVGTLYRAISGDTIKPFDKVAGDTLYGGPLGFVSSMADLVFQKITGKDFGATVLALVSGDDNSNPAAVANAATPPASATAASASPSSLGVAPVTVTPDGFSPASLAAQTPLPVATAPAYAASASVAPQGAISPPGMTALQSALSRSGIDPDTANRAAYAYRRAVGLVMQPLTMPDVAALPAS